MEENINHQSSDYTSAFGSEKKIMLYNCGQFHVRMFTKTGKKRFTKVSQLPRRNGYASLTTQNQEFSLYDKEGREMCVVIFPQSRYLANQNFEEKNSENLFEIEWTSDMACTITYTKKSYTMWIVAGSIFLLFILYLLIG